MQIFVLDSSAVLNDFNFEFSEDNEYFATPQIISEFKDLRSKSLIEAALHSQVLKILEPKEKSVSEIRENALSKGFQKLSNPDISILALALEFKRSKKDFVLVSDDYSIQNFAKLLKIPFESIIQGRIKKVISFKTFCSGCGKKFPNTVKSKKCYICGARLKKST